LASTLANGAWVVGEGCRLPKLLGGWLAVRLLGWDERCEGGCEGGCEGCRLSARDAGRVEPRDGSRLPRGGAVLGGSSSARLAPC